MAEQVTISRKGGRPTTVSKKAFEKVWKARGFTEATQAEKKEAAAPAPTKKS